MGNVNCVVKAEDETVSAKYTASHLVPNVESIVAKAVAEAKEEEVIPEIEYETLEEEVTVPITSKGNPVVTFLYKIDDTWIEDYSPRQTLHDGENILPLFYPISGLGANSAKQLEVYMSVEGGEITIAPANCKAAVAGSSIASGFTEWDGKLVIEESVNVVTMAENVLTLKQLRDSAGTRVWQETIYGFADSVSLIQLENSMGLIGLSDLVEIE